MGFADIAGSSAEQEETEGDFGERLDKEKYLDTLMCILDPTFEGEMDTQYGPADACKCAALICEGPDEGRFYPDQMFFGKVLAPKLGKSEHRVVVGRLGQSKGKPGKNPAWIWNDGTDDEFATVTAYLDEHFVDKDGSIQPK